jgi:hypothetical protein
LSLFPDERRKMLGRRLPDNDGGTVGGAADGIDGVGGWLQSLSEMDDVGEIDETERPE